MLSLSSSHSNASAPWPHQSEVVAPQPSLAGLGATHPIVLDSPEEDNLQSPASEDDGQHDASFYVSSGLGSQPAVSIQSASTAACAAPASTQADSATSAGAGVRSCNPQRHNQLPTLNTSFSLTPPPSSSSHFPPPVTSAAFASSPLDTSASLSSATTNQKRMPFRHGSLQPTGSLSFADSLSTWSLDCVGPPLDETNAGAEDVADHQQSSFLRGPHICRQPDPLPQFQGSHLNDNTAGSWKDRQSWGRPSWPEPPASSVMPTPPPEALKNAGRAPAGTGPRHSHFVDLPAAPPHAPALEEQQIDPSEVVWDQGKHLLDSLVEVSILAINSIWPSDGSENKHDSNVLPLDFFVKEVINRSSAGTEVIQLALYYLHRARSDIRTRIAHYQKVKARFAELSLQYQKQQHATEYPSPPSSPLEEKYRHAGAEVVAASKDPVVCGRRMFLAALIIASKFLQDRTYSNRAWARLSGLTVQDVSLYERSLLQLLDYRLFVSGDLYDNWRSRLSKLQQSKSSDNNRPAKLSPLQKARSEYGPYFSLQTGLHAPAKPQQSPSPNLPQLRHAREDVRMGRSTSNTELTAHAASKPNFFPTQNVPARPRASAAGASRQRCDSASSIRRARASPAAGPYAAPNVPSRSFSSTVKGLSSSTTAAAAPLRTVSGSTPSHPTRSTTPLRSSSRSSMYRPPSASVDLGASAASHCRPVLSSFTSERPHWLMGHHHHSASRQGFVH